MAMTIDEWKEKLAALPIQMRADLAHFLFCSLDEDCGDHTAEWLAVAESRMAELRAGKVRGVSFEEFLESLPGGGE